MRLDIEEVSRLRQLTDTIFKFKVGDIVQPKAMGDYADTPNGYHTEKSKGQASLFEITMNGRDTVRYQVLERWLQECHGGVQLHYTVIGVTSHGGTTQPVKMTEGELILSTPFKRMRGYSKAEMQRWVDTLPADKLEGE